MLERHARLYALNGTMDEGFKPDDLRRDSGGLNRREPKPEEPAGRNFEDTPQYQLSAFYSVAIGRDGRILASENAREIYTHEELNEIALQV